MSTCRKNQLTNIGAFANCLIAIASWPLQEQAGQEGASRVSAGRRMAPGRSGRLQRGRPRAGPGMSRGRRMDDGRRRGRQPSAHQILDEPISKIWKRATRAQRNESLT